MCLSPITIINPSKYVNLRYRERYLLQVPCGHCAQCATNKHNEWYYRCYAHSNDCLSQPGNPYIYFDTLTYAPKHLPHISDFIKVPDPKLDFPCFNRKHLQLFNKRLRRWCDSKDSSYTYFVTSEYGTSEKHTHRPHYHILFYTDGKIPIKEFSAKVASLWKYGRTDGLPYQPYSHVLHNTFFKNNFADSLRTVRYVSKYVQKSCLFDKEITKRLDVIMDYISQRMIQGWSESVQAKRVRMRYNRLIGQFHLQSLGYGASALADMDMNNLIQHNTLKMPDSKKVQLFIPLPMYYKRKLFYDVVKIQGNDTWLPSDIGNVYLAARMSESKKKLVGRFTSVNLQFNLNYDPEKLADYVTYYRGRIKAKNFPLDKQYIIETCDLFNYVTLCDREHIEKLGLTPRYAGNNTIGYRTNKLFNRIKFKDFIDRYVFLDKSLEHQLDVIYQRLSIIDEKRQTAYELRQRLTNLYHHLGF